MSVKHKRVNADRMVVVSYKRELKTNLACARRKCMAFAYKMKKGFGICLGYVHGKWSVFWINAV